MISDGDLVRRDPACTIFQASRGDPLEKAEHSFFEKGKLSIVREVCVVFTASNQELGVICRVLHPWI